MKLRRSARASLGPLLLAATSALGPSIPPLPIAGPPLPAASPTAASPTAASADPIGPEGTWTLTFGGDTLLTRRIGDRIDPFAGIRPPLAESDLAIVNLETAVSTRGRAQAKTFTFRSPPTFADRINASGIDVVSLANNHSLDFGLQALFDTIDNLDRASVAYVGAGRTLNEALAPATFEISGTSVAVLGASQIIPNGAWPATLTRPGIASAGKHVINRETQQLLAAVRSAKEVNDVVIVVMHWGIEGDPCPSVVQRQLGRLLRDNGATAVLGAHPHILQPIVRDVRPGPLAETDGGIDEGVIAYSLGNFIWDPRSGATGETGTIQLRFTKAQLSAMTFSPHRLDANGWAQAVNRFSARGQAIAARVGRACPGADGVSEW